MQASADQFKVLADELGIHPAPLAIAWVMSNPAVTSVLVGARNLEQLETALQSTAVEMTDELYERVSAISPTPPPATDRNEERLVDTYGPR
jgi:aryl-alcohol dehydrogenase-like predicted oxidoreductase